VPLEERLVHRHILDGDDSLGALELDNAVDEQERVTVRQEIHDFLDGKRHSAAPLQRRE
jgi:hypothetical protein